jgi:hypothetical protein
MSFLYFWIPASAGMTAAMESFFRGNDILKKSRQNKDRYLSVGIQKLLALQPEVVERLSRSFDGR